ncbi:hypothetical protein [Legionella sp. CNM-4043-24]|uniref:hypothetical protein n=1 Tax=Legionella sp. CNM-4043-24 TaxID=3421646 RepID=UPI00403B3500
MKSFSVLIGALGLLVAQGVSAASCSIDKSEMYAQISQYGSLSTHGCPFNKDGWGVIKISEPIQSNDFTCSATCTYARGAGSTGTNCNWQSGNWGNTLSCN